MKNRYIISATILGFIILGLNANAQVTSQKIGTNPTTKNAGAVLEVEATDKGVLLPRVALTGTTDTTTVPNRVNALTVFNTATVTGANAVTPGYYYWNTTSNRWVAVTTEASNDWKLGGNAGTNPATHFIGTTDNQPLVFKVNNKEHLRITPTGRFIIPFTSFSNFNVFINGGNETTTGVNNVVVGGGLTLNTTGSFNSVYGNNALMNNQTGNNNTAIGSNSMQNNESGRFNTGLGSGSLSNNISGQYNLAIGYHAGNKSHTDNHGVTTQNRTISIGYFTALTQAMAEEDYTMNIGNFIFGREVRSVNPNTPIGFLGIGVNYPQEKLEVAGAVKISSTNTAGTVTEGGSCTKPGTMVYHDASQSFYGCAGTTWKKLHN
ncbi:hypothetical protein G6R40_06435 [Chryseobacterium sp. POL2]|uniref:hypothetical protein n=1 Tax=Chryseobacterium sp. POL2 TaxID=2713414 RepID=UPI0013E104A0|nr:hypothetical protein [Chryseobacterium sp. POL2]QIG89340.1 hypothetical protein G6R40_06435 [Chryseobacterium sp. POL2]